MNMAIQRLACPRCGSLDTWASYRCPKHGTFVVEARGDPQADGKPSPTPCPGCRDSATTYKPMSMWCNAMGCGWRETYNA
jgi:hypothetical protein